MAFTPKTRRPPLRFPGSSREYCFIRVAVEDSDDRLGDDAAAHVAEAESVLLPPLSGVVLDNIAASARAELHGFYAGMSQEDGAIIVATYLDRKSSLAGYALAACNGMAWALDQAGVQRAIVVDASDGGHIAYHGASSARPCVPSLSVRKQLGSASD